MIRNQERFGPSNAGPAEGERVGDACPDGSILNALSRRKQPLALLGDDQLVDLARGGHEEAFAELVERHRHAVSRLAFGLVGEESEASDIVQEAFLALHQKLPSWDNRVVMKAWLLGVARNKASKRVRKRSSVRRVESEAARMKPSVAQEPDTGGRTEAADGVSRAVKKLSDRQKAVVSLHYLNGLSVSDTAKTLGMTDNRVREYIGNGLRALRRLLTLGR